MRKSKSIYLYAQIILLFCVFWPVSAFSTEELAKGWYDPKNDWFEFEWKRPSGRWDTTIYDPPNKIKPAIKATVAHDMEKNDYIYGYEVSNMGGKQLLYKIIIDCFSPVYGATAPSDEWYMDWYDFWSKDAWKWAKTGGEQFGIPAGETVSGFSFRSGGIPGIVNSTFFGYKRAEFTGPGDFDTLETNKSFDKIFEKFLKEYSDKFKNIETKTIGPTAPPKDLNPVDFLDNLISMKHEAFAQGWITNKGVETSLDAKLDAARRKLLSGSFIPARNTLLAFINEVEAQGCETHAGCKKGKHIKPEAYAILKYNALYLIDNLR